MINILLALFIAIPNFCWAMQPAGLPADLYTIDETIAVVAHPYGRVLILLSDLRLGIDGKMVTLKDLILEHLMVFDALQGLKVKLPEDYSDRLLTHLQKSNNLTREQLLEAFKLELGYSEEEVRELLHRKQLVETDLEYRVKGDKRLIVQEAEIKAWADEHPEEIKAYSHAHPDYKEASYTLVQVCLPTEDASSDKSSINEEVVLRQDLAGALAWDEPFTVKESQLPDDKRALMIKPEGAIISIEPLEQGVEVTKLLKKTEGQQVPFEALSSSIAAMLRQERLQDIVQEYHKRLLSEAKITYSSDTWRRMIEES
jgi:hypothetical protein